MSSQNGFTKGKSCLATLLSVYDKMIRLVDAERTVDVAYLDFRRALETISHNMLIDKLKKYDLDKNVAG